MHIFVTRAVGYFSNTGKWWSHPAGRPEVKCIRYASVSSRIFWGSKLTLKIENFELNLRFLCLVLDFGCIVLGVQSEVKCICCASVSSRIFWGSKLTLKSESWGKLKVFVFSVGCLVGGKMHMLCIGSVTDFLTVKIDAQNWDSSGKLKVFVFSVGC